MNQAGTGAGKWIDWAFDGLAVLFFCATLYLIWQNARNIKDAKAGNTAVAALLAVFCALMGNPDRFQTFKFSFTGIEASARQAIQQVEVTVQALQKMASAFAEASLTELAMSGQLLYGTDTRLKFAIHDDIVASLKEIQVPDEQILKDQRVWITVYCRMILDNIEEVAGKLLSTVKVEDEIEQLPKQKGYQLPSPEAVRNWAAAKSLKDAKLTQFLDEYEKVWTTGAMYAPDLILPNQVMKNRN
jgi:hypothetical protein